MHAMPPHLQSNVGGGAGLDPERQRELGMTQNGGRRGESRAGPRAAGGGEWGRTWSSIISNRVYFYLTFGIKVIIYLLFYILQK